MQHNRVMVAVIMIPGRIDENGEIWDASAQVNSSGTTTVESVRQYADALCAGAADKITKSIVAE